MWLNNVKKLKKIIQRILVIQNIFRSNSNAAFMLLHLSFVFYVLDDSAVSAERWMFNQEALQEYLLICCQYPAGGLIDKPGR